MLDTIDGKEIHPPVHQQNVSLNRGQGQKWQDPGYTTEVRDTKLEMKK